MSGTVRGLRVIALIELTKGALVLIAAGAILAFLNRDVQSFVDAVVRHFHMNPARHHPHVFAETVANLADTHRLMLSIGAVCYACVRAIEGYGLWHQRAWAWGFGIMSGALYVPFELVELSRNISALAVSALVGNILVVAVLWHAKARVH